MSTVFRRSLTAALALWMLAATPFALAQVDPPPAYYDPAIGVTGVTLKATLHEIIKGHTVLPYTSTSTDTWDALKVLDQDPADASRVMLIYSGYTALKSEQSNGITGTWNREHFWPQSFGLVALSANSRAKTDVFNLRPVAVTVNSSRGNTFYDVSTSPVSSHPDAPASSYDGDSWEPRDADKGAVARALFYMAVRYDGTDSDVPDIELSDTPDAALYRFGKLTTLLAWHRQFPATDAERQRNQRIYSDYQHNRNPFIDHPDYADMVFNGLTPGQAWKNTRFTSAELGNSQVCGDLADPDGDGLPNLLEYAFNRQPKQGEQAPAVSSSFVTISGTSYIYLSFPRNRNASDVVLSCESSSNLQSWNPVSAEIVSSTITNFETEQLTIRVPATTAPYFVRLRATK